MSTLRCVTFDLDDTLWEMEPVLHAAEAILLEWIAEHLPRVDAAYDADALLAHRRAFYATLPELAHDVTALRRRWLVEVATANGYSEALAGAGFHHFWEARNRVQMFEPVPDALAALGARYRLGTITNGNADVHHIGIGHHFAFVVTATDAGVAKPERGIFDYAVAASGVAHEEIVHVGDDPVRDVAGAQRAGLRAVWVNPTGAPWSGPGHPDAQIASVGELPALLESW